MNGEWQGGFIASVDVTNLGDAVTGRQLTWSMGAGQTVAQLWNEGGAQVVVDNKDYRGFLGAGASAGLGFVAGASGSATPGYAGFALNGTTA
ncbi:cellulose-binding domain-containing protein [Lentzea sp. NBC_00516]|uniref:cellulose binding domain-containing protein n=1 Tax=Lentzea sp. NBC_00516 TaxID=2903582 RepID=UPI002E81A00A|nr:cellulose binding domain-containing protein [Lentzea sp. NBC_00516]WUD28536.1 cellulose-binding domain-containing protein [Lentzea sp. NBC_00516]